MQRKFFKKAQILTDLLKIPLAYKPLVLIRRCSYGTNSGLAWGSTPSLGMKALTWPKMMAGIEPKMKTFLQNLIASTVTENLAF